jgi:hypothetical protein
MTEKNLRPGLRRDDEQKTNPIPRTTQQKTRLAAGSS